MALPGYDEAADALEAGMFPGEWLTKLVNDKNLSEYTKQQIGIHLNFLTKGALHGKKFASAPGLDKYIPQTPLRLRGLYQKSTKSVVLNSTADAYVAHHELLHMMRIEGLIPEKQLKEIEDFLGVARDADGRARWSPQNEEDFVSMMDAAFVGNPFDVPPHLVSSFTKMRDKIVALPDADRAYSMLERMPDGMAHDMLDTMLYFRHIGPREMGFHGASKDFIRREGMYMPEVRALPTVFGKVTSFIRSYGHGGGRIGRNRTANITPTDPSLTQMYKAGLQETGAFDKNVLKGTVSSQRVAARVWAFFNTHQHAVKIGTDLPTGDPRKAIAIPKDPGQRIKGSSAKEVKFLDDLFDSLTRGRRLTERDLRDLDDESIDAARKTLFHGLDKDTAEETAKLAEELMITKTPIEGVVWVNADDLLNTGLFEPIRSTGAVGNIADAVQDYLKALVLVMKPSYIPMNLIGQNVMLLMQQGALAPVNLLRSFAMHAALGDYAALIDFHAGTGSMRAVFDAKGGIPVLSKSIDAVSHWSGIVVDRYPRRAAFLYEASRMGYRTTDELITLLTNPNQSAKVSEDLKLISQATRNAMVDFDNLSQAERNILTRLIFVYPWLKGATYWAARFPKDHPLQSMAYAYLVYEQQERLHEEFPDGFPGYMKWYLPFGKTERNGEEYPMGLRLDQALTFLTPLDIASDLWGLSLGQGTGLFGEETEPGSSNLGPLYQEIVNHLQGYDAFTGQPVSPGLLGFLKDMLPGERAVVVQQIQRIMRSDEERRNKPGIYPTTKGEDWLRLFLGSLAKGPIDPNEAADRAAGLRPDAGERIDEWERNAARTMGGPVPPHVLKWKQNAQAFSKNESALERELGTSLTVQERAYVALKTIAELNGKKLKDGAREGMSQMSEAEAEALYADIREELGLSKIDSLDEELSNRRREDRVNG